MKQNIILISFLAFIFPLFTVLISYFFSIQLDLVKFCIPNLEGCTSISRVGRFPPVSFFFKPFMFISAFIIFLYWKVNYNVLTSIKPLFFYKINFCLGIFSVIFFSLYVFFLGEGEYYKFFRKIGIFIYIFFTVVSELLLSISYRKNYNYFLNNKFVFFKFIYNLILTFLGLILLPLVVTKIVDYPNFKNIASWNYFFLIQINFLFTYFCWIKNK